MKNGDKVKLVSIDGENEEIYKNYLGQVFTIKSIDGEYVKLKEIGEIWPFIKNLELVDDMDKLVDDMVGEIKYEPDKSIEELNQKYDELYNDYQYLDGYIDGMKYIIDSFAESIAKHINECGRKK